MVALWANRGAGSLYIPISLFGLILKKPKNQTDLILRPAQAGHPFPLALLAITASHS